MRIWERYRHLMSQEGSISALDLEITSACNLACTHCYKIRSPRFLEPHVFTEVLRQSRDLGIMVIGFNGGEPALHPHFLSYAKAVLEQGMLLSVVSNGTLLTDDLLKALSPWKGVRFQISLYGHDPASFHDITGAPARDWEPLLSRLTRIRELGFHLEVILLALDRTAPHLPALVSRLEREGLDLFTNPVIFAREDGDETPFGLAVTNENYHHIAHLEQYAPMPHCEPGTSACGAGMASLAVTVEGTVVPCLLIKEPLGEIMEHSLDHILRGEKLRRFCGANTVPSGCVTCEWYAQCVRCPGAASFTHKELHGVHPETCRVARIRTESIIDPK